MDSDAPNLPQIVVCGSIAIDRIMNFQGRYQDIIQNDKLHVLSVSLLLDKLVDSRGGIGANMALNLAQLGEKPILIGSVGRDAEYYMNDLKQAGIDISQVHYSDSATASFNVITDSDDNQVGGFYQGAMGDSDTVSFIPWQGQNIIAVIAAHNPEAMNRQVEECKQYGIRMVYDPGQQVADNKVDIARGIAAAELVFLNDYELGTVCRKLNLSAEEIKKQIPILVTTLGKSGSIIEGSKIPQPIEVGIAAALLEDPTGAGDAYRAGFLYGYLRQWDMKSCAQLGATLASFIIEHHGTQQIFSKAEVIERYRQNFNEEVTL